MSRETTVLSTGDYFLLQGLSLPHGREWELLGTMLRRKLHEAVVAFPEDMDPQIVRIGSTVAFSSATETERRVLTIGNGRPPGHGELPLQSTRGLALLGARAGQSLCVPVQNGGIETLQLLEVAQADATAAAPPTETPGPADNRVVPFLPRRPSAPLMGHGGDDPGPNAA